MKNLLPISNRTVMLDLNGVRAARGISADKVNELVEAGELLWVFNLGRDHHVRNLRFWFPEVVDTAAAADLELEFVISQILPPGRHTFNGSEICQWFLVSRPTVKMIGAQLNGEVKNRLLHIGRETLTDYLRARWIGGGK